MNIDYTVTALMFPAIPLIMAVYSNRFHTLSALIRKLHDEYVFEKHIPPEWEKQLKNLSRRINYLKFSIGAAGLGFLFNMMTVLGLYLDKIFVARLIFATCCISMIISIVLFLFEIFLSTNALKLHLSDMKFDGK
jgi:hypothetical protein|tara:strand:+ start:34 stop:438 length:405 start_codon:yes stop_codon:yes gene_type:complete